MDLLQLRNQIDQLTVEEKLRLVGEIWESIASDSATLPLSDSQKHELELRYAAFKSGKLLLQDADAVHEELRTKYR